MELVRRNTVGDAVRRAARVFRDREALVFGDRSWSFNDLDRAASRVAGRFAAMGLKQGDRIAAYGRNSDGYFIAWLAWLFIHIAFLVGFRNKLAVLLGWAYAYLNDSPEARVIVHPPPQP